MAKTKQLRTSQVSKLLGLSSYHITRLIDSGALRGYRFTNAGYRRVALGDVLAFADEHNIPVNQGVLRALCKEHGIS